MDEDVVVGFIVVMEIRKGIEWKYVDVCMTCHAMQCYAMLSRSLCVFVCAWGCVRWINLANTHKYAHTIR